MPNAILSHFPPKKLGFELYTFS